MEMLATTISEHIFNQGLAKGEVRGEVKGQLKLLHMLRQLGVVTDAQFESMAAPLRRKFADLTAADRDAPAD